MNYMLTAPIALAAATPALAAETGSVAEPVFLDNIGHDLLELIDAHRAALHARRTAPIDDGDEADEPLYVAEEAARATLLARRPRSLEEVQMKAEYMASSTSFTQFTSFAEGSEAASLTPRRVAAEPTEPPAFIAATAHPDARLIELGDAFDLAVLDWVATSNAGAHLVDNTAATTAFMTVDQLCVQIRATPAASLAGMAVKGRVLKFDLGTVLYLPDFAVPPEEEPTDNESRWVLAFVNELQRLGGRSMQ